MEVREGTEGDIRAIVDLLKKSLGEHLMPKSENYWRWKHVNNPFGISPVLLCEEGGALIGVRAFMRWRWVGPGYCYDAVRAVDTATHPDHLGKGIFKKLTLALVDICTRKGDHFVFNTPNEQSRPGYLKMGWVKGGKLPVHFEIRRPFNMIKNIIQKAESNLVDADDSIDNYLKHPQLPQLLRESIGKSGKFGTDVSTAYLKWRYLDVPVASYFAIGDEDNTGLNGLIIGRAKTTRFGREFRLTDIFLKDDRPRKSLIENFTQFKKKLDIDYCTVSGTVETSARQVLGGPSVSARVGPIVTLRSLSLKDLNPFINFNDWSPTLGDLELF